MQKIPLFYYPMRWAWCGKSQTPQTPISQGWGIPRMHPCVCPSANQCSTISRATPTHSQPPPLPPEPSKLQRKKCCGNLSLSPTGAKTLEWRGLGLLPCCTWAEPPTPILPKYFSYVTYLLPPHTAQISLKTKSAQYPTMHRAGNMKGKIVVAAPGAF